MIEVKSEEMILNELSLGEQIENMRKQLTFLVQEKGSFTHPSVVLLSQELDLYIIQSQLRRLKNKKTELPTF